MKKAIIFSLLAIPTMVLAQSAKPQIGDFAHISEKRDTLYLLCDDPVSNITYQVWTNDKSWKGINPVILFVEKDKMVALKKEFEQPSYTQFNKTAIKNDD